MSEVPSGEIELIRYGSEVPEDRRDALLDRINAIISTNWNAQKRHWSREHSPFQDDFGLLFFHRGTEIVGYSLYKRMRLDGIPLIYRAGAEVMSSHQRSGIYSRMTTALLRAEWETIPDAGEIYYAWRTRNPAVWVANSRLCRSVVPALRGGEADPQLEGVCLRVAEAIYPDAPIERPTMIMRGVYGHMTYHRQPQHPTADIINTWFNEKLSAPADSVFSVGVVPKTAIKG